MRPPQVTLAKAPNKYPPLSLFFFFIFSIYQIPKIHLKTYTLYLSLTYSLFPDSDMSSVKVGIIVCLKQHHILGA